jgi:hypothetical protein
MSWQANLELGSRVLSTPAASAPSAPLVTAPVDLSAFETDFSAGQDDLSVWWEGDKLMNLVNASINSGDGDELLDLVNTSLDSDAGALASAVAASVQVSGLGSLRRQQPQSVILTFCLRPLGPSPLFRSSRPSAIRH